MRKIIISFAALIFLSGCTEFELASHVAKSINPPPKTVGTFKVGNPYQIKGRWYTPAEDYHLVETGIASWYGPNFHGKLTANGEIYDQYELTAAHRTLQMPSLIRVTNLENGRALVMRVNDRGPFARGRILDVSKRGAELLGFKNQGTAKVRVEVLTEESKQLARIAQSGQSTQGMEIAANERMDTVMPRQKPIVRTVSADPPPIEPAPTARVASVQRETLTPPLNQNNVQLEGVHGHVRQGNFYPDAKVEQVPVPPVTNIFVQAGSFSVEGNALSYVNALRQFGEAQVIPAKIGGRTFYRVRLPANSVDTADLILERLANSGNADAIIIVE